MERRGTPRRFFVVLSRGGVSGRVFPVRGAEEFGEPVGEEVGEVGVEGFVGREVVALKEFGNEECEFEALFFEDSGFTKLVAVHWLLLCALQCALFFRVLFRCLPRVGGGSKEEQNPAKRKFTLVNFVRFPAFPTQAGMRLVHSIGRRAEGFGLLWNHYNFLRH